MWRSFEKDGGGSVEEADIQNGGHCFRLGKRWRRMRRRMGDGRPPREIEGRVHSSVLVREGKKGQGEKSRASRASTVGSRANHPIQMPILNSHGIINRTVVNGDQIYPDPPELYTMKKTRTRPRPFGIPTPQQPSN